MLLPSPPGAFKRIDRRGYAAILAHVANADTILKPEELAAFESRLGRMLIHPEVRKEFRKFLRMQMNLDELCADLDQITLRYALRDSIYMAKIDGELHPTEVDVIRKLAQMADIDDDLLREISEWVDQGLNWMAHGRRLIEVPLEDDDFLDG
jgi:uncharacterized tellurite resistance protein B-like protein